MKIGSIKSVFIEWLKSNLEKILIVIVMIFLCLYMLYKFQEVIDGQKSVARELKVQDQIHQVELEKISNAYDRENQALKENLRIYEEKMAEIEKKYDDDIKKFESKKTKTAANIIKDSGGDSKKVAEAVAKATGFSISEGDE